MHRLSIRLIFRRGTKDKNKLSVSCCYKLVTLKVK